MHLDWNGGLTLAARRVLARSRTQRELQQLRAAATLKAIRPAAAALPDFSFTDAGLSDTAYIIRMAELQRPPRERRRQPGALPTIAAAFEDLAGRAPAGSPRRLELLAEAASMWSVAGYQANSVVVANQLVREIEGLPDRTVPVRFGELVTALLLRDLAFAERLGREAVAAVPALANALLDAAGDEPVGVDDAAVLAAYGLLGQAAIEAVQFWQRGDEGAPGAATRALTAIERAARLLLQANIVDTWLLADNLRVVLEDAFAASLWRGLRGRAPVWNNLWRRHIYLLAENERPVVEIWSSQRCALEAGLLDPARMGLVARMPTSAGKTRMAEFAILATLADRAFDRLSVYVVPTRSLAAEIERRLSSSLGELGLRVSALFGGLENVDYELTLVENTDVLVVTTEKLDLLLRQSTSLGTRLSLVIVDEGHLLADLERGLRLELLLTRLRRRVPLARVILLSAVLPNADEIGAWLEPTGNGANAVTVDWSPSRLATGVFFWQGGARDGQFGRVRYAGHDEQFFVPYVLRRQKRRTKLYPNTKSQTAAELALHYQRLGPVIVGAATKPTTRGVAKALHEILRRQARGGDRIEFVDPARADELARLQVTVRDTVGDDHELATYVVQGFAYHHADVRKSCAWRLSARSEAALCGFSSRRVRSARGSTCRSRQLSFLTFTAERMK